MSEEKIFKVNIEDQMKSAYIDYAMSVIVSRALPDVRDGLKPVHRRVLFGMHELGTLSNKSYKKSARIVGEVLGKYHPHGDTSVYDAMVRMAQEWSLRYPLIDGQGNFGSIDGDSPAAMRYTEARLKKIAEEMLVDIEKETVDFQFNFDDTLEEPTVLPARIPNLLINGSSGIAVGMATNMPPHNLGEVIDGTIAYIDDNEIDIDGLMQHIKGPDFPTGGVIYGYTGVKEAMHTGRGRIVMRGEANIETLSTGKEIIIVTSIPYQVNKADMIKRTADLVNDKKIEGITDIRDESDREGLRIVYELRKDAVPNVVLNQLFQHTALQTSFNVNNIALVKGRPEVLNLKDLIRYFVDHRHDVVIRRSQYELREAEKRAHILEGFLIALDNLDEVIKLIRESETTEIARNGLMERFSLSEKQARAILEMRLRALTGMERDKIKEEYQAIMEKIEYLKTLLADEGMRMDIIKAELLEIKEKYDDKPRTEIEYTANDFRIEDTIADEDVIITVSHLGYIKRTPLSEYKLQSRGGRGSKGTATRDDDFVEYLFSATNHNYLLFFTEQGKCFWMRVFELPEGSKSSKGRAIQNLINIPSDDKVKAFINLKDLTDKEYTNNNYIILATKKGIIKKTSLESYSRPRANGIIAINIRDNDELLDAKLTDGKNDILLATKSGKAIRFNEQKVRAVGRNASGVKGITLANDKDEVVGMVCIQDEESSILVVSEKGYGKKSPLEEYRVTNRGGKGIKTLNITEKTGSLIAMISVVETEDLMIINKSGFTIRMSVSNLRTIGRATQGVRLINLKGGDKIAAVTKVLEKNGSDSEAITDNDEGDEIVSDNYEETNGESDIKSDNDKIDNKDDDDNNTEI
ncbi:MAG: DNA gyrase subunit A [Bacteroidota bacterium]